MENVYFKKVCISLHFYLTRCNPWASIFPYCTSQVSIFFSKGLFGESLIREKKFLKCKLALNGAKKCSWTWWTQIYKNLYYYLHLLCREPYVVLSKARECFRSGWKTNWTNLSGKHTQVHMFPYFLVCKLYKEVKTRGGEAVSVPNRLGRI